MQVFVAYVVEMNCVLCEVGWGGGLGLHLVDLDVAIIRPANVGRPVPGWELLTQSPHTSQFSRELTRTSMTRGKGQQGST